MLAEKQKIVSTLEKMTDKDIQNLWVFIQHNYPQSLITQNWEDILVDTPTKEEKAILDSIDENDDDFISQSKLLERLGLTASDL